MVNSIGNSGSAAYEIKPYNSVKTPTGEYIDKNSNEAKALKRNGTIECETCKNRKYQDASNESDVSFKSPGHVSPQASTQAVRAHEQQHVSNAYQKEADGAKVVSASVSIQMARCPECGRSYASGGETTTTIKYNADEVAQNTKILDAANGAIGNNVDISL